MNKNVPMAAVRNEAMKLRVRKTLNRYFDDPAVDGLVVVVFGTGAAGQPSQHTLLLHGITGSPADPIRQCVQSLRQHYGGGEETGIIWQ